MAAPTNVRVESNSITTTVLNWSYPGTTNDIGIYRAPHGGAYSLITTVGPTIKTYTDTGLNPATYYDYKLSDDSGATFSSVVSVTTQACPGSVGSTQSSSAPGLPQFNSEADVNAQNLQQLSQQVEGTLNTQVTNPQNCTACPVNGAVVIDCTDSCFNFTIIATTDINSITINSCPPNGQIDIVVPPGTTRKICGFPPGWGFTGDECFHAPIVGGANGKTVTASKGGGAPNTSPGQGKHDRTLGGAGAGGPGCGCVPNGANLLTIKSCTANNSLGCSSSKSLSLIACGGIQPYTWSKTGSITLSKTSGLSTSVTPPVNNGSGVAGVAYTKQALIFNSSAGNPCVACNAFNYGGFGGIGYKCDDTTEHSDGSCGTASALPVLSCPGDVICRNDTCTGSAVPLCVGNCDYEKASIHLRDVRSGAMIAAGCNPCGLSNGATVSVTDAAGTIATIILTT